MNSFEMGETVADSALVPGAVCPRTYREFVEMFPDDMACAAYLEKLRWPDGFVYPACKAAGVPWRQTRGRLVCTACRHQSSVCAGTILDKTRTPLTTWFEAAWHVTTAKNGMSAKTLERTLGTSYRVAWTMCCSVTELQWCVPNVNGCRVKWKLMKHWSEVSKRAGNGAEVPINA